MNPHIEDRMQIWQNTCQHYQHFIVEDQNKSIKYRELHINPNTDTESNKMDVSMVELVKGDMIDYTINLKNAGYNPIMLNMASDVNAGA
jgi:hypothetical protein